MKFFVRSAPKSRKHGYDLLFPRDDVRQEAGMILEVYAEGLRHDILVSNIQEVRALDQNIRQH